MKISIIAAMGKNRVIGKDNTLPWHVPADLKRFKELTMGKPVVMGRNTWDSLPDKVRPLPGRLNIILSNTLPAGTDIHGTVVCPDFSGVLRHLQVLKDKYHSMQVDPEILYAWNLSEVFIIGGAQVYSHLLEYDLVDKMYLTFVEQDVPDGDAFFPEFNRMDWLVTESDVDYSDRTLFKVFERRGER
ncbi:dihydrofolate reductase [Pseudomonas phage vB_PpuM-Amme-1]